MITLLEKRKKILSSHVFRYISYYVLYCSLFVVLFSSFVSIISFFHFLLDHRFIVIEEWIHRNGWELLILAKVLASFITLKFISIRVHNPTFFKKFLLKGVNSHLGYVIAVVIFMLCSLIYMGQPILKEDTADNYLYNFISYFGSICLYGFDILILAYLRALFPLRRKRERLFLMISLSIIFYLFLVIAIPFGEGMNSIVFMHMIFCLYLLELYRGSWSATLVYLILLVAPCAAILGLDPIWAERFSPFELSVQLTRFSWPVLWLCAFIFLKVTRNKSNLLNLE